MQYRADIEGLRAISVILVFLFHLGITEVPGGFIGVDVFFVTSGYLISGILLRALEAGTFSLVGFYERRVRRIVPALLLSVAVTLPAGHYLLFPGDYKVLADSGLHAMLAVSNFFFYWNTGYFDGAAELAPLLHTWSLGVEEQFYFVWPLLLAGAFWICRGRADWIAVVVTLVIVVSFGWNLWQTGSDPKGAFYLPFSRAWELAVGTLIVLLPKPSLEGRVRRKAAEWLAIFGIAAIGCGALILSANQPYPGAAALLPVLGAAALLYRTGEETFVARKLSSPTMVFIGKLSYSLYLWHWPVIVFARHYNNAAPFTPFEMAAIIAISFAGAWLSWQLIEKPFRFSALSRPAIFASAGVAAVAVGFFAWSILERDGLPERIPAENRALADKAVMWQWACPQQADFTFPNYDNPDLPLKPCILGANWETATTRGILWGDSNAQHLHPLIDAAARKAGAAIATIDPCSAIVHSSQIHFEDVFNKNYMTACTIIRDRVVSFLKHADNIDLVIIASSWSNLPNKLFTADNPQKSVPRGIGLVRAGLESLVPELVAPGRRVILFADFPNVRPSYVTGQERLTDPVSCVIVTTKLLRRPCDLETIAWQNWQNIERPVHEVLRKIAEKHAADGVSAYFPQDHICTSSKCRTWMDDEFLYRDSNHIRRNLRPDTIEKFVDILKLRSMLGEKP